MSQKQKCQWCEKPAEFLCDFITQPAPRAASFGGRPTTETVTCSAPMCRDHRKCVASGMIDCSHKSGRRGGPGTGPFSIDYCPDHAKTE